MNARIVHILRYPVKSIGGEALDRVALTAGQPLPGDRRYGVMHQGALHHLDGGALLKWLPKSAFLRGAAAAPLQAIRGGWDGEALLLTHPDLAPLRSTDDRLATLPPTLVVTAEGDPLRDEGERLARRLAELGVEVTATRYLGQVHGFWRHPSVFDAAEPLTRQVAGFLRMHP